MEEWCATFGECLALVRNDARLLGDGAKVVGGLERVLAQAKLLQDHGAWVIGLVDAKAAIETALARARAELCEKDAEIARLEELVGKATAELERRERDFGEKTAAIEKALDLAQTNCNILGSLLLQAMSHDDTSIQYSTTHCHSISESALELETITSEIVISDEVTSDEAASKKRTRHTTKSHRRKRT
jgi:hypothetical protein